MLEQPYQLWRVRNARGQRYVRKTGRKTGKDPRHARRGDILGNTESQFTAEIALVKAGASLVVQAYQALREIEQPFAIGIQVHAPVAASEQATANPLLEPFHLVTDRGLRQIQAFCRPRDTAGFGDYGKCAHGFDIKRRHYDNILCKL